MKTLTQRMEEVVQAKMDEVMVMIIQADENGEDITVECIQQQRFSRILSYLWEREAR